MVESLQNLGKTDLLIRVAKVSVGADQDPISLFLRLQYVSESVFHALEGLLLHHLFEVSPVVVDAGESLLGESEVLFGETLDSLGHFEDKVLAPVMELPNLLVDSLEDALLDFGNLFALGSKRICFDHWGR